MKRVFAYSKFVIFLAIFTSSVQFIAAQNAEEKPENKDFGWSLRKNSTEIGNKNQVNKEKKADSNDDVIRVETNLVINDILVFDNAGNSVKGLKKEDFIVFEDENPQQIESFSLGENSNIPRSIVLIIDYSGSMLPFIRTSIEAAKVLVDKLKPNDRLAIVTDDVELLADFTGDKDLLKGKLELLKNKALAGQVGKSEQFSALYAVLNEIFDKAGDRPIVIFQTDGDELIALKGGRLSGRPNQALPQSPGIQNLQEKTFSFEDILTSAEKARASVYTIYPGLQFLGIPETEQLERAYKDFRNRTEVSVQRGIISRQNLEDEMGVRFMRNYARSTSERQLLLAGLAKYTGGGIDFLEQPGQADDVYNGILSGINNRYVIGYYPTNEAKDGKRRVIKIEVRGHPEYTIWGRKTYFAPEMEK